MWCSLCQLALLHLIMCLCTCLCTSTFFPSLILVPCMIHNHLCLCSESIHFQHLKSWSFCEQSVYITIKRWPNWHRDCVETCTSLLDSHLVRHLIGKIGITSEVITESKLFYLDRFKMFSIKAKESSVDFGRDFMMKKWSILMRWMIFYVSILTTRMNIQINISSKCLNFNVLIFKGCKNFNVSYHECLMILSI